MTFPVRHPGNTPLNEWTDGWLKMEIAGITDPAYIVMDEEEMKANGLPVTRKHMIKFLLDHGYEPNAGVDNPRKDTLCHQKKKISRTS